MKVTGPRADGAGHRIHAHTVEGHQMQSLIVVIVPDHGDGVAVVGGISRDREMVGRVTDVGFGVAAVHAGPGLAPVGGIPALEGAVRGLVDHPHVIRV